MSNTVENKENNTNDKKLLDNILKDFNRILEIFFENIYRIGIMGGILICALYFILVIRVFPDIDGLQIIGYLIMLSITAVFIAIVLFSMILAPAFMLSLQKEILPGAKKNILLVGLITISLLIAIISFVQRQKMELNVNLILLACFSIALLLMFYKNKFNLNILVSALVVNFVAFASWILLLMMLSDAISSEIEQILLLVVSYFVIFFANYMLVEFLDSKDMRILKAVVPFLIVIVGLSIIALFANKDDPFIVGPFKMLKLGNYYAKIKIDDKFAEESRILVDNNLTENPMTVFVLSSIGSEYIFKKDINKTTIFRVSKSKIEYVLVKDVENNKSK